MFLLNRGNKFISHCKNILLPHKYYSTKSNVFSFNKNIFKISNEVEEAIHSFKPIVALESTIITHGMPFPDNLQTAKDVESLVRLNGAVPATICVIDGSICVGMSDQQLEQIASPNKEKHKLSRRDMSMAVSFGLTGGTTVSSTTWIANQVGLKVFATGGIGGVHRHGQETFDISADLHELANNPVLIVSSGIKSILDMGRTLEYLETIGVTVGVFNAKLSDSSNANSVVKESEFPAFYSPKSGFKAPYTFSDVNQVAKLMDLHFNSLNLKNSILIGNPNYSKDSERIQDAIEEAVRDAEKKMIEGKEVTPFILARVNELTSGDSLKENINLIKNNATQAAKIAVAYASVRKTSENISSKSSILKKNISADDAEETRDSSKREVVVIGGSIIDYTIKAEDENILLNGSTFNGSTRKSIGGVGRNMADAIAKLGHSVLFISAVGNDSLADDVINENKMIDTSGIVKVTGNETSNCFVILDKTGECKLIIGNMKVHKQITPQHVAQYEDNIAKAEMVVMDANISIDTMNKILEICHKYNVNIWFEPTDLNVAAKITKIDQNYKNCLKFCSPNFNELQQMAASFNLSHVQVPKDTLKIEEILEKCNLYGQHVLEHLFDTIVVTLGHHGVAIIRKSSGKGQTIEHFSPPKVDTIASVSGAGDCFSAAMISGILRGYDIDQSVNLGLKAAAISLNSYQTVPDELSKLSITFQS